MDYSPNPQAGPVRPVPLLSAPLSPWLRLAHVTRRPAESASHDARLRVLLDFELVFQFEGSSWIWSDPDGGSVDVRTGDVAFIPPDFRHGWAGEAGAHIAVHFDLHARPEMVPLDNIRFEKQTVTRRPLAFVPTFRIQASAGTEPVLPLVTRLRAPALWHERLRPLVEFWSRRANQTLAAQMRTGEVVGWALRTIAEDAAHAGLGSPPPADERILELLRKLDATDPAFERPTVDGLAASAGMGLTAFRAAFHAATGRAPRDYLEERRIERAARALVETNRKVLEISRAEGYEDPYHFSRVFKRVTGQSPRAYRRRARG